MNNLIHAEMYRIKNSLLWWCISCASIVAGTVYGIDVTNSETFDDMFVVPLFVLLAIFISLIFGREYSDGTIRNKIIAGKTKTSIFLSRIIIIFAVTTVFVILFLIPFAAITYHSVLSKIPPDILLWFLLGFVLVNYVWAILFTVVSTLISSREVASILNLVLIIVIMFTAYQVEHMIGQPQYYTDYMETTVPMTAAEVDQVLKNTYHNSYHAINEEGTMTYYKVEIENDSSVLNNQYVNEPFRTVLVTMDNMLPHGQINMFVSLLTSFLYEDISKEDVHILKVYPLYSLGMLLFLSALGLLVFRKKELK